MNVAMPSGLPAANRPGDRRGGLTLVELLVVIAIMTVLIGLLVPTVQGVRETARQRLCQGNLQMIAQGVAKHDDSLGYVPGWNNRDPGSGAIVGWGVALLPYIEQTPAYDAFRASGTAALATAQIATFLCPTALPADIDAVPAQTSYAGSVGLGTVGLPWAGVMGDTTRVSSRIRLADIDDNTKGGDGTAWTILMAEKCGATIGRQAVWTGTLSLVSSGSFLLSNGSTWMPTIQTVLQGQPDAAGRTRPVFGMNYGGLNTNMVNTDGNLPINGRNWPHTVPSSLHRGGAMAVFCDGRTRLLADRIDTGVYAQIITASHNRAGSLFGWTPKYPLSDADLRDLK